MATVGKKKKSKLEIQPMTIQSLMKVTDGHLHVYTDLKACENDLPSVIKEVVESTGAFSVRVLNKKEEVCFLDLRDVKLDAVDVEVFKLYEIGKLIRSTLVSNKTIAATQAAFDEWRY
jgi:hypothetical protein